MKRFQDLNYYEMLEIPADASEIGRWVTASMGCGFCKFEEVCDASDRALGGMGGVGPVGFSGLG